jgi:hypothetical protein
MIAQCALTNAGGAPTLTTSGSPGNGVTAGITQYYVHPPGGPDQGVDFGWNPNFGYPAEVWDNNMTSVNAEMLIEYSDSGPQWGKFSLTVFYLS